MKIAGAVFGDTSSSTDGAVRTEPLRYLNLFRLVLAGLFLVAGRSLPLGSDSPILFVGAAFTYLAAVLILGFPDAARLMGTPTVICGMSAPIAMTLQTMGADFRLAQTALTLEDALVRLGVTATVTEIEPDDPTTSDEGRALG